MHLILVQVLVNLDSLKTATRIEDFDYAADYLTTLVYAYVNRIGVYGGYAVNAAMIERCF
ncbi:hypothetical protein ACI8B_500003 [Acinetobacter proteolyticus]|uniref:Uncharacterized protein n=1 Tax=Acinetobacter proteolyticus TaxID=1776741 RepID=A0A653KBG8_9GAMM|nr:hypothetical protein ACI8B_500003 [Acinetobacter proteolyticus]